jgi:glucose-1-phosphate cytidylyltransferase
MQAMILCGGRGTRLREHTETLPKPLVEIGGRPILWHIMKSYAAHGITDFILCLGYKGHLIKDYFLNYESLSMDFSITLGRPDSVRYHGASHREDGWNVTLVDTGQNAMTGARVKRASRYLDASEPTFALTYGDGVSNVDLQACLKFHQAHGGLATVTGVQPPGRFGELQIERDLVTAFTEKPEASSRFINGGFFFLDRAFLDYLSDEESCVLEQMPLEQCAADRQLHVYEHTGYWQCMDTNRDWERLERDWASGSPPWKVWE